MADCFASIDYFEHSGIPFIIAVNCFDGAPRFEPEDIRIALSLGPGVPVVLCDVRQRNAGPSVERVRPGVGRSPRPERLIRYVHERDSRGATGPGMSSGGWIAASR